MVRFAKARVQEENKNASRGKKAVSVVDAPLNSVPTRNRVYSKVFFYYVIRETNVRRRCFACIGAVYCVSPVLEQSIAPVLEQSIAPVLEQSIAPVLEQSIALKSFYSLIGVLEDIEEASFGTARAL